MPSAALGAAALLAGVAFAQARSDPANLSIDVEFALITAAGGAFVGWNDASGRSAHARAARRAAELAMANSSWPSRRSKPTSRESWRSAGRRLNLAETMATQKAGPAGPPRAGVRRECARGGPRLALPALADREESDRYALSTGHE
jgi:hypothetical protein